MSSEFALFSRGGMAGRRLDRPRGPRGAKSMRRGGSSPLGPAGDSIPARSRIAQKICDARESLRGVVEAGLVILVKRFAVYYG